MALLRIAIESKSLVLLVAPNLLNRAFHDGPLGHHQVFVLKV